MLPIYKILETEYNELLLDYILLELEGAYLGEASHKEAVNPIQYPIQ